MSLLRVIHECCSVLQCVTICCNVLLCAAMCCSMLQYFAVYWKKGITSSLFPAAFYSAIAATSVCQASICI